MQPHASERLFYGFDGIADVGWGIWMGVVIVCTSTYYDLEDLFNVG